MRPRLAIIDTTDLTESLASVAQPADAHFDIEEMRAGVAKILLDLSPLEERVVRMRFGIGCEEHTLEAIGDETGIGKDWVRRIEVKALKRLSHPSRAKRLRVFVPEPAWRTRYRREKAERIAAWRARWAA